MKIFDLTCLLLSIQNKQISFLDNALICIPRTKTYMLIYFCASLFICYKLSLDVSTNTDAPNLFHLMMILFLEL